MVHQSNAYFERCHTADYDPSISVETKHNCWAAWLEHYREGQTPDRIGYASHRLVSLDSGADTPPLPGLGSATVSYTASYLSSSPEEEPDEATAEVEGTDEGTAGGEDVDVVHPPQVPHDDLHGVLNTRGTRNPQIMRGACAAVCGPRWDACMEHCEGRDNSCQRACEAEQRICMRGCF